MRRFYTRLAAGQPKDEALRAAQLETLRSGGVAAHPRHWAAFQLYGDWR
jgi:CHAT domain-containing protein